MPRSVVTRDHPYLGRVRAAARLDAADHAQALGIDDRDAVREAVGHVHGGAVRGDGDAPGAPAHLLPYRGDDLVVRRVYHVDGAGAAAGDVEAARGGVHGDLDGPRVEAQVDRLDDRVRAGVDDGDRAADLRGDVRPGAV